MPHILYFFATLHFNSPWHVYKNCIQSLKRFRKFMLQYREESLNTPQPYPMEKRAVHVVVVPMRARAYVHMCVRLYMPCTVCIYATFWYNFIREREREKEEIQ